MRMFYNDVPRAHVGGRFGSLGPPNSNRLHLRWTHAEKKFAAALREIATTSVLLLDQNSAGGQHDFNAGSKRADVARWTDERDGY